MDRRLKYVLLSLIGAAVVAAMAAVWSLNSGQRHEMTCTGLRVEIADDYDMVTQAEVEHFLRNDYGPYIGQRLDSVNLDRIERILDGKGAILKAEAYTTKDSLLHILVTQRRPVVRFQRSDGGFYSDAEGFLFPLQENFSPMVPIIDGDIPLTQALDYKGLPQDERQAEWLGKILGMISYMASHDPWTEDIVQITVQKDGDIVMIPRKGKERFIFGPPTDVESKFRRMADYYGTILPEKGEGYYSTVNLKFSKQIVCRK